MSRISYKVARTGEKWSVSRNGEADAGYVTQEAAFEVATANASADLRCGYDVVIQATAPTSAEGASPLGGEPMPGDGFS